MSVEEEHKECIIIQPDEDESSSIEDDKGIYESPKQDVPYEFKENSPKKKKKSISKFGLSKIYHSKLDSRINEYKILYPIEELLLKGSTIVIKKNSIGSNILIMRLSERHYAIKQGKEEKMSNSQLKSLNISKELQKYYLKRYFLFKKYDEGIVLDDESWYSVTPEEVALHIALKSAKAKVILDAFCGAGGNAIQFAKHCSLIIANDIDRMKLTLAENNAEVYKVKEKIRFINYDFLDFKNPFPGENIDLVFLSPPWGGSLYLSDGVYDLSKMKPDFLRILKKSFEIAKNVILFLPRSTDLDQLCAYLECVFPNQSVYLTVESVIYETSSILGLIIFIGPLFMDKPKDIFNSIERDFQIPFDNYQKILLQNIIKLKSFEIPCNVLSDCNPKLITPTKYIEIVKSYLTPDEWNTVKKMHKKKSKKK